MSWNWTSLKFRNFTRTCKTAQQLSITSLCDPIIRFYSSCIRLRQRNYDNPRYGPTTTKKKEKTVDVELRMSDDQVRRIQELQLFQIFFRFFIKSFFSHRIFNSFTLFLESISCPGIYEVMFLANACLLLHSLWRDGGKNLQPLSVEIEMNHYRHLSVELLDSSIFDRRQQNFKKSIINARSGGPRFCSPLPIYLKYLPKVVSHCSQIFRTCQ